MPTGVDILPCVQEPAEQTGPADQAGPVEQTGRVARARAGVATTRRRAEDAFHRLEQARATSSVVDTGFHLYDRDNAAGGPVLAGALAFRLFVFMVPYAFVVVTLFGTSASLSNQSGQEVARETGLTGVLAKSVTDSRRQTDSVKVLSLLVGGYALYAASRSVVKTTRAVHALAWRVRLRRARKPWRGALLVVAVALATSAMTIGANSVRSNGVLSALLVDLVAFVAWAGIWLGVSALLPRDPRAPWTALVPGALLIGLVTSLMHFATVVYFSRKISSASDTYGALGIAITILLMLYLVGRAIAASAVLNATIFERKAASEAAVTG